MIDKFAEMKKLWEEAEADNQAKHELLVELWKETKDKRIEKLFASLGGCYVDGVYMFKSE